MDDTIYLQSISYDLEKVTEYLLDELQGHELDKNQLLDCLNLLPTNTELQDYCIAVLNGKVGEYIIRHLFYDIISDWCMKSCGYRQSKERENLEIGLAYKEDLTLFYFDNKWYELNTTNNDSIIIKKIPCELDNEKAKTLFQKTINIGLCDNNYRWLKSKALLAYFADKASEYLGLGKGEYYGKSKTKTSWKPFESLFGVSGLAGAKRDWEKTGTLPQGNEDVDKLF